MASSRMIDSIIVEQNESAQQQKKIMNSSKIKAMFSVER